MTNVTEQFNTQYAPYKALLLYRYTAPSDHYDYQSESERTEIYVESYDIGRQGQPINAHPLTIPEMMALGDIFNSTKELDAHYLCSKGLLPPNVIYVRQQVNGFALWYTPPMENQLFFTESNGIPNGKAHLPALLWKASNNSLSVFALKGKNRPNLNTPLYHAPFFNIYAGGNVCMGTVNIHIAPQTRLEEFMLLWQDYFFLSDFSHSINGNSSTRTDTGTLWRSLIGSGKAFPQGELVPNGHTLKDMLK